MDDRYDDERRTPTIQEKKWNEKWGRERDTNYDDWLEKADDTTRQLIAECKTPIIDLGCGNGNDTRYLLEQGKKVIPCDLSSVAIENIKKDFPQVEKAFCFNMLDKFPFLPNSADIIISDLSLHYFSEQDTRRIIEEIKRVLKPNGILVLRVNSINDTFWGAGQGEEIERHFYRDEKGLTKRFFDIDDIHSFFEGWKFIKEPEEKELHRYDAHKEAKDRNSLLQSPGKKTFVCTIQVNK